MQTDNDFSRFCQVYINIRTQYILINTDIIIKIITFIHLNDTIVLIISCCYIITGYFTTAANTHVVTLIERMIVE